MGLRLVADRTRHSVSSCLALWICLYLSIAGCGQGKYEDRLKETVKFAAYREKLNLNLAAEWAGKGIRIRVPKQFQFVPGPPEPAEGEESPDEEPPDLRQPEFFRDDLPGIVAAWMMDVDIPDPDNPKQSLKVPAYLYVLSNYDLWEEGGEVEEVDSDEESSPTEDALDFNNLAANVIVDGLDVEMPGDADWALEKYPPRQGYVVQKKFTAAGLKAIISLKATVGAAKSPDNGDRAATAAGAAKPDPETANQHDVHVNVNCKIYLVKAQDIRVTVLYIIPEQIEGREKLSLDPDNAKDSRIALSLETLSVSTAKPSKPQAGGRQGGF